MGFQAQARKVELKLNYDSSVPRIIHSDSIRIRQIIINLVGNALKFTEKGSIKINVSKDIRSAMIRLQVIDSGIGIKSADIN
jgi:signal transduction histidine kinase